MKSFIRYKYHAIIVSGVSKVTVVKLNNDNDNDNDNDNSNNNDNNIMMIIIIIIHIIFTSQLSA
jgi:hypothetical protein